MKTLKVSLRSIVLGLTVLGVSVVNVFAANYLFTVSAPSGPFIENGTIYSVPAGANFEWDVSASGYGFAHIILGGGGLNVNQSASSGQHYYDVGSTTYADSVSYQLSANTTIPSDSADALFYLGW